MPIKDYKKISEAQIGDNFSRPVLISSIAEDVTSKGNPFVRFEIRDGFSKQKANMFDMTVEQLASMGFVKGSIAEVTLYVDKYKDGKSYKINDIAPVSDPSLTADDFIKVPPIDCNQMYDEICALLESAADDCGGSIDPLSYLALTILKDHKKNYIFSSAAVKMHHNMKGGLIYHSYRMTKAADAVCSVYPSLDRELLLCGAALHDIGKIWEFNTSPFGDAESTPSGILMGHAYIGASLIKGYTEGKNYSKEKIKLLVHLILSHHGVREWGAAALPAIPEAFALHVIDNLDAKLNMFEEGYASIEAGKLSDQKIYGLDTRIYKPSYFEK